ncbi:MAG: F0F1 ATP synthase subunit B [Dehalococcoidia bacterium]|nr:F0F1 ATP synthase subunit B [Dehalococcoidia bacterium]
MKYRIGLAVTIIPLLFLLSGCEGLAELGVNWHGLLSQFISFGLLLVILGYFAYKPITRMLDQRSERIKESMEQADRIKQQSARTEEQVQAQLTQARKQGQELIVQAEQIGERLKAEAREQARLDAEAIVARTRAEIQTESEEALAQLRREFAEVAILAAEKVIKRTLDKEAHRDLIEEAMKESTRFRREP